MINSRGVAQPGRAPRSGRCEFWRPAYVSRHVWHVFLTIFPLIITSCATVPDNTRYIYTPDPDTLCRFKFGATSALGKTINGCTALVGGVYVIVQKLGDTDAYRHESRHTTEGSFHR